MAFKENKHKSSSSKEEVYFKEEPARWARSDDGDTTDSENDDDNDVSDDDIDDQFSNDAFD
jgi:hypothetical protein